jgi:hypothetical protein
VDTGSAALLVAEMDRKLGGAPVEVRTLSVRLHAVELCGVDVLTC